MLACAVVDCKKEAQFEFHIKAGEKDFYYCENHYWMVKSSLTHGCSGLKLWNGK